MHYDKNNYEDFKLGICSIFQVEDALDANGFKIPTEITSELADSPKHQ